jgi:ArsR family transcriptional regulator
MMAVNEARDSCESPPALTRFDAEELVELELRFQALADRYRLAIVDMLVQAGGESICVCEFQTALDLKQPTVSYHLRQLVETGVIEREQRGRYSFYSLRPGTLEWLGELIHPAAALSS